MPMDKKSLFDIYNNIKPDSLIPLTSDVIKHMQERGSFTSFIIDELLPAVRENEKFKQGFNKWFNKKNIILFKTDYMEFLIDDNQIHYSIDEFGGGRIDMTLEMLEGYERRYCQEILREV